MQFEICSGKFENVDNIKIKHNKRRAVVTIYDTHNSKSFPICEGVDYLINNGIKCSVDIEKVKHTNINLVYDILSSIFNEDSGNKMYKFITLSREKIKDLASLKNFVVVLYPREYIKGDKGYVSKNLEFYKNISFKRRTIKGFIINANYNDVGELLPGYLKYSETLNNIKGMSLLVKSDHIKSLECKIKKNNRPASICIVIDNISNIDNIDNDSIIKIMTWSTDCYYRRNGKCHEIINIYKIMNETKSVEDMLTISRISVIPNNVEKYILTSSGLVMDDAIHILHTLSCVKLSKNETYYDKCSICINYNAKLTTKCGHKMCLLCFVNILNKNICITCPYCMTKVKPRECTLKSNIIHSRLYTIYWITGSFNKSVIYIDDENDKNVIKSMSSKDIFDCASIKNTDIDRINNLPRLILLATHKDIGIVQHIRGIDNIICKSDNNKIITNKQSYGYDFINRINKLTLSLYSYTLQSELRMHI